jgi:hypothetical protein
MSEGEAVTADPDVQDDATNKSAKLDLGVEISEVGPCRKHVVVTVAEADISSIRNEAIDELSA